MASLFQESSKFVNPLKQRDGESMTEYIERMGALEVQEKEALRIQKEKILVVQSGVPEYINRVNSFLETCNSIYRVGFTTELNYFSQSSILDIERDGTCNAGRSNEFRDKIQIGVFFIYNISETPNVEIKIQEHLLDYSSKRLEWMKSATDIWYNTKANVVDFAYGCTKTSCRQRNFSTLTRLPIILYLLENNNGISAIVNHAFPFTVGKVDGEIFPLSQIVLCKKLNFFTTKKKGGPPGSLSTELRSPFIQDIDSHTTSQQIQQELYSQYLSSSYGQYFKNNILRTSVSYNTFLMLGDSVTVDTLPLLKETLRLFETCAKGNLWDEPDCAIDSSGSSSESSSSGSSSAVGGEKKGEGSSDYQSSASAGLLASFGISFGGRRIKIRRKKRKIKRKKRKSYRKRKSRRKTKRRKKNKKRKRRTRRL